MIFDRLRVFVSSSMEELAPERLAVKAALDELKIDAWVFERDAGARPTAPGATFRQELANADLYLGLFWHRYGPYTIEEFDLAAGLGKDRLIHEKRRSRHVIRSSTPGSQRLVPSLTASRFDGSRAHRSWRPWSRRIWPHGRLAASATSRPR